MKLSQRPTARRAPLQLAALVTVLALVGGVQAVAATIHTDLWIYQKGDTVQVFGEEFGPVEIVDVVTTSPTGAPVDAGTSTTDDSGAFTYAFVLDSDESGIFDVVATGRDSGLTAATQFDPAHASLSPTSKAYGNVNVGSTSAQTFTISNTGTTPLNISSVVLSGGNADQFTLSTSGMSTSVAAGSSTTFSVAFAPTSAGAKTASVDVTTNAEDPSAPLTGTGVGGDVTPPSVGMSSAAPEPTSTAPIPVTVTFSEPVTGFVAGDITPSNGSVSNFSGSGASYTFDLVPAAAGVVTADIAANVATDAAGNPNTAATQFSRTYAPNTAPTISDVSNQTIAEDGTTGALAVTVGDAQTAAGSLTLSGASSDVTLVPNGNISFGGSGANRTVTVVPAANRSGSTTVTLTVSDGSLTASDTFTVTVSAVNDEPSFTSGGNVTVNEDSGAYSAGWATAISAGPSDESSQALTFHVSNDNNGLFSSQPAVASNGTLTFTPAAGTSGSATVSIYLTDDGGGTAPNDDTSPTQTFTITVTAVNHDPSATDDSYSTDEDTTLVLDVATGGSNDSPADNDSDPDLDPLTVSAVSSPTGGSASIVGAEIRFVPTPDTCGAGGFDYTVSDGNGGTDTGHVGVTITCVDDDPVANDDVATVTEDDPATTISVLGNDADDDGGPKTIGSVTQPADGTVVVAEDSLSLTYEPDPDACNDGSPTDDFTYSLSPGGSTATVEVSVDCVNDEPGFTPGGDVTVAEDSGAYSAGWATTVSAGPANESGQALTFYVSNDDNGLFSAQPAIASNGSLTFTPAANANGSATVSAYLTDDGGTADGGDDTTETVTFTITVGAVNDAPSFTKGADQTVAEDSGTHTVVGWATAILAGPSDESGQALTFAVTNDDNALFSSQPAVASNGALTFTPATNASGSATVTVTLSDDGGTANGGDDTSAPHTFTITVTPVNDDPDAVNDTAWTSTSTAIPVIEVLGNDTDLDGDTLSITAFDATSTQGGAVACAADCSYTPPAGFTGTDTFGYAVGDGHGGSDSAAVTITVSPTYQAPALDVNPADQTVQYSDPIARVTIAGSGTEGAALTLEASGMPPGVTFSDLGNGRGSLEGFANAAPGTYTVQITLRDDRGGVVEGWATIVVTAEDATVAYTGDQLVFTEPGTSQADVSLSATVTDSSASGETPAASVLRPWGGRDLAQGDVSRSTATFMKGARVLCGPVPVLLVDPSNPALGVAVCDEPVTLPLGTHDVDVHLAGTHSFSAKVGQVEVDRDTRNYVTGGGYVRAWNSGGTLPADDGSRVNFGFRVRFNPRLTNVRGHANVIFVSDGRTYQARSRDMEWVTLGPGAGVAELGTSATLSDVTDPLSPTPLDDPVQIVFRVTDAGATGDRIAICVYRGSELVFASRWEGAPVKKTLAEGGIVVG